MKTSLRWKMLVCFLIASIIPLFLCLSIFIEKTSFGNKQSLYENMDIRATQSEQLITDTIIAVDKVFASLIRNADLREFLISSYPNRVDALAAYNALAIQAQVDMIANDYTVRFYNTNPNTNISSLTNNSLDDFIRKYGEDAVNATSHVQMQHFAAYGTQPERIGFYRVYSETANPIYVTIEVPMDEMLLNTELECALLLDSKTAILNSNPILFDQLSLSETDLLEISQKRILSLGDESYLATIHPLSTKYDYLTIDSSLSLLCLYSYQSFEQTLRESLWGIIPLCLLCVVFSLAVSVAFTRRLASRLSALQEKTRRVLNFDFNIAEPITIPDELGNLEADIYDMAAALSVQIEREYEAIQAEGEQRLLNEKLHNAWVKAQLSSLRHQINPHYLFNTLESIRMHLLLKGDKESSTILQMFAASYRKSLEVDYGDYTLRDELETINDFLAIQKYRLGDRFISEIQIEEDTLDCKLPKLILQPLVENAFFHGIELSNRQGHLRIQVHHENDQLSILVTDNGLGITEEKLKELKEELEKNDASSVTGIGINNIANRIRLLYGPDTFFDIESQYGSGTTVKFQIPYRK